MSHENAGMEPLHRYYALWRESNAMYEEWAKAQGLSLNGLLILYSVCEDGPSCTQKQISQKWCIPKQTVHAVLKEFEAKGYMKLIPAVSDRRNKEIQLTSRGRAFGKQILSKLHAMEAYAMEQMGLETMKEMNDQFARFMELFRKGDPSKNE